MPTTRATISLDESELRQLQADAAKEGRTLSNLIVSRAVGLVGTRLPPYDADSLDSVRSWLKQGTLPLDLLSSLEQHAPTLVAAVHDFPNAGRIYGADFEEAAYSNEFVPRSVRYPNDDRAMAFQNELREEYAQLPSIGLIGSLGTTGEFSSTGSNSTEEESSFHMVRAGLVARKAIIYLYPFFLPPHRRPTWGVLPYAKHEFVGLLLHRECFTNDNLPDRTWNKERIRVWFGSNIVLQLHTAKNRNKLGFRESFFEEEISELLWSHSQSHLRFAYEAHRRPLLSNDILQACTEADNCGAIVADRFEAFSRKTDIERLGWIVLELPHHFAIPAGLGFTVSALPRLIVRRNWHEILRFSRNLAHHVRFRSMLEECGLTLLPRLDEKPH